LKVADCKKCGKKMNFLNGGSSGVGQTGYCDDCHHAAVVLVANARMPAQEADSADEIRRKREQIEREEEQKNQEIDAVLLTTETHPDLKVVKRIEIVTAEVAFGMNLFKDLFAGVRDIVGGRSEAVQKTMRDSWTMWSSARLEAW
jgi:hypothetical protein